MGSVTSTLERMVIDVAWGCHEWFYGSASGTGTCAKPRPLRRRCRPQLLGRQQRATTESMTAAESLQQPRQQQETESGSAMTTTTTATSSTKWVVIQAPPAPGRVADSESELSEPSDEAWVLLPRACSTPTSLHQHHQHLHQHRRRRRATMSLYPVPSPSVGAQGAAGEVPSAASVVLTRTARRAHMNVPQSTLQAVLFRCTAARNGCLRDVDSPGHGHGHGHGVSTTAPTAVASSKQSQQHVYPVRRLGRSWSVHNASANRAATL